MFYDPFLSLPSSVTFSIAPTQLTGQLGNNELEPERGISPRRGIMSSSFSEEMRKIIKSWVPKGCSTGRFVDYDTISKACSPATFVAYCDPLPNN